MKRKRGILYWFWRLTSLGLRSDISSLDYQVKELQKEIDQAQYNAKFDILKDQEFTKYIIKNIKDMQLK